ncbi:MAG: Uma2 family endonuclease [Bryobacteraceae bacterium]
MSAIATSDHTELIDGVEIPKPLVKKQHAFVQAFLIVFLSRTLPPRYWVASELNVLCGADRLVPDVTVTERSARYIDGDLADPPLLAVEILSPGQTIGNLFEKSDRLLKADAPMTWIIWPERRKAWMYTGSELFEASEALRSPLPAGESIEVALKDLWAELD